MEDPYSDLLHILENLQLFLLVAKRASVTGVIISTKIQNSSLWDPRSKSLPWTKTMKN